MNHYAELDGDLVVNVSLWDGVTEWTSPYQVIQLPEGSPVGVGYMFVDGEWIAPVRPEAI
jgi:hypothetical protein